MGIKRHSLLIAAIIVIFGGRFLHRLFIIIIAVVCGIAISKVIGYSGPVVGELVAVLSHLNLVLNRTLQSCARNNHRNCWIRRTRNCPYFRKDKSSWNPNKEFVSQGVANLASAVSNSFQ